VNRTEIIAFMNANPVCHLATVEDGTPKVRAVALYRADSQGILFHTGASKALYHQLVADPRVEFCFNDPKSFLQVRATGRVEAVDDRKVKKEIVTARPFLKGMAQGENLDGLAVFRAVDLKTTVWTMSENGKATEYQDW
jgi:uncharacterized pyridoxamine 5'-phosphate oxidase family protein